MRRGLHTSALAGVLLALVAVATGCGKAPEPAVYVYRCNAFTLYADSVAEGPYCARATGPGSIVSNYSFTDSSACADTVRLRFCLNGRDSEMALDVWHTAPVVPGDTTAIMVFGSTEADTLRRSRYAIPRSMRDRWTIRLDMRPILRALDRHGFYVTGRGDTVFADYFKGVWVAGPQAPLTDDTRTLRGRPDMQLLDHGDSTYLLTLNLRDFAPVRFGGNIAVDSVSTAVAGWHSRQMLPDAVYGIAATRLHDLTSEESHERLGTMATAHAVCLSLAVLDPDGARELLRRCVSGGRVRQDAGAGGAWPVSSERLMWIVAAYEVYKATGDREWLREAEEVARHTLADDEYVLVDPSTGLLHGGTADTGYGPRQYPHWFSPRDIFATTSLRVNAGYFAALEAYAAMRSLLCLPAPRNDMASLLNRINFGFWMPDLGRYSSFLYCGFYPQQAPVSDCLGQSLAVLADIAAPEMASALVRTTPRWHYGPASSVPVLSTATDRSMANTVEPEALLYWILASAKAGNRESALAAAAALYRNWTFGSGNAAVNASTGRPVASQPEYDTPERRMLSDAAAAALTLRLFAGIRLDSAGMHFQPYIPPGFSAAQRIERLRYRNALLDIEIRGTGDVIHSMTIDGHRLADATIPADTEGHHIVRIFLRGNTLPSQEMTLRKPQAMPPAPSADWTGEHQATILDFVATDKYLVRLNGAIDEELTRADYNATDLHGFTTITLQTMDSRRVCSFATRPRLFLPKGVAAILTAERWGQAGTKLPVAEGAADRFIELSPARNLSMSVDLTSDAAATYFLDVRYANGGGQEDAQTRCVIRTVKVNGMRAGTIVMPCLGEGDWLSEAYSNAVVVKLRKGLNRVSIDFDPPYDRNAAGSPGTALINHVRLIRRQ